MAILFQPLPPITVPPGKSRDATENVPVILWGASQDISYNQAGGGSTNAGPFTASLVRLAQGGTANVRVAIGNSGVTATSSSTLLLPGVEFVAFTPGSYIAVISNDATSGSINVTQAL